MVDREVYEEAFREAKAVIERVLVQNSDEWMLSKSGKTGSVYHMRCHKHGYSMFKGVSDINGTIDDAIQCVMPSPVGFRGEWDKSLKICEVVENIDENSFVLRTVSFPLALGLIAPREFIDVARIERHPGENYAVSYAKSVKSPKYPEEKGIVRGTNFTCGCFFETLPDNKTRINYTVHVTVDGNVPMSLVEATLPNVMKGHMEAMQRHLKARKCS